MKHFTLGLILGLGLTISYFSFAQTVSEDPIIDSNPTISFNYSFSENLNEVITKPSSLTTNQILANKLKDQIQITLNWIEKYKDQKKCLNLN